jgi:hypothetical protein
MILTARPARECEVEGGRADTDRVEHINAILPDLRIRAEQHRELASVSHEEPSRGRFGCRDHRCVQKLILSKSGLLF